MMHTVTQTQRWRHRWRAQTIILMFTAVVLAFAQSATTLAQSAASNVRAEQFQQAATEFNVPVELLLALSYSQSRWESHGGKPSTDGGYGPMHLTTSFQTADRRGSSASKPQPPMRTIDPPVKTLDQAATILGVSKEQVKTDPGTNIRGAAALLATYAKQINNGQMPHSLGDYTGAIAKVRATDDAEMAKSFVDQVYTTLKSGASTTTSEQQTLQLAPQTSALPNEAQLQNLGLLRKQKPRSDQGVECPPTIVCKSAPAYHGNAPGNPGDYGNYSVAERPRDMDIKYIVIHDMEGAYQDSIDWFQNPASYASAHYLIRSSDGEVTQAVKTKDVAWHAGNWQTNMHSVGIEHEGFAAEGASWYSEPMYRSSAQLVRYVAQKYNIPIDREHIVGHDQYQAQKPEQVPGMHYDPGPYWDWDHYMQLIKGYDMPVGGPNSPIAAITLDFHKNKHQTVDCDENGKNCVTLPLQGTNFAYLRTAPREDAPLMSDPGLHPDGSPGTNKIDDTSAKATQGQRFAIAERRGDWTAIWFGGQKAWLKNSQYRPLSISPSIVTGDTFRVTPKAGKASIPVYGAALPEASAYPPGGIQDQPSVTPLQYTIKANQQYVAYAKTTPTDYFYAYTIDGSVPHDHTVFVGKDKYIPISYNHRQAFVRAADVEARRF